MARTASTVKRQIEASVSVIDFVYHVARNNGTMLTEQQIGSILFQNEAQVTAAMRDAGMAYLKPVIDKMAGILPRVISDEETEAAVEALVGDTTKKAASKK